MCDSMLDKVMAVSVADLNVCKSHLFYCKFSCLFCLRALYRFLSVAAKSSPYQKQIMRKTVREESYKMKSGLVNK